MRAVGSGPGGCSRSGGASQHVRSPRPAAPPMSASKLSPTIQARSAGAPPSAPSVSRKIRGSGFAARNPGLQCTPSASRVPPKSKRTTSVVLVMPVARAVVVRRRLHRHHLRHPHFVAAALPHVVAVILLIQRVRAVGGRPLDATV